MGGRVVLFQLVLNLILTYQMSVSVLSEGARRKLHGLFNRFLWGGLVDRRKLHLVN